MYQSKKFLLIVLLAAAAVIIWLAAVTTGSRNAGRQDELMAEAQSYLDDLVYVRAAPLLEEAAAIDASRTQEAQRLLADCYHALGDGKSYLATLLAMLDKLICDFAEDAEKLIGMFGLPDDYFGDLEAEKEAQ